MTPRLWGWVAILVIASAYEVWGVLDPHPNDTLSELTRRLVGTGSIGRWAFIVAWGTLGSWYVIHILGKQQQRRKS